MEQGRPDEEVADAEDQGCSAAASRWAADAEDCREPWVGQSTLSDYLKRAARAGLAWPLPEALTDAVLEQLLFQPVGGATRRVQGQPDWAAIHRELRRKNVTLSLLWEEYQAVHPYGYGYSRFCELYRRWEGRLAPTMRQHHVAGERMFVDYAGASHAIP